MPYFGDLLDGGRDRAAWSRVVREFATQPHPPGTPLDLGAPPENTPERRARGATLYKTLACWTCHGDGGRGDGPSAAALRNEDGTPARPADLTRPWTFLGGSEPADIAMRVAAGVGGTPMPGYTGVVDARASSGTLAYYVRGIARAPTLEAAADPRGAAAAGRRACRPRRAASTSSSRAPAFSATCR